MAELRRASATHPARGCYVYLPGDVSIILCVTGRQMGIYSEHIFPRLMESGLKGDAHRRYRRRTLARAHGEVLEVGFGTALNLECYPESVRRVTGLDSADVLERRVRARIAEAPFPVERLTHDAADRLPFPDGHFDTVASTWTLCSIERLQAALGEMRRVLKPAGELLFLEHGRNGRRWVARVQDAINPVQNLVACGCNLNRKIDEEIEGAGFRITELDRFVMPGVPRALGSVYLGSARSAPRIRP
ncbi:class I SAM-dependent methyltransferase [Candidatus Palauibacter sp.]|uniref:class I SAM-dependent methyltransferase n=1 Tax=Candidatus Palauibacter sp. TaxID=3101350 RepID=UPI003AF2398F